MRVLASLTTFLHAQQAKRWPDDERRALLRLFYEVITADGIIGADELTAIEAAAADFGVPLPEVLRLHLPEAMALLRARPRHLKVACLLVAPAFLLDGDLDKSERAFLDTLSTTYNIPDDALRAAVDVLRQQRLDDALRALHDEAFSEANVPHEPTPTSPTSHEASEE
jgi:uncharacterized tellurite resistance protein B-like protein